MTTGLACASLLRYRPAMAIASLVIAILAILIAFASANYTRRQACAAENQLAIEKKRLHDALTPQFSPPSCATQGDERAHLTLELTGPPGIDRLDEVTVRIRDDRPDRVPTGIGDDLPTEEWERIIWGPYRFAPGIKNIRQDGRVYGPVALPKNEPLPLVLERSRKPSWITPADWRRTYEGAPVRLEVTCRAGDHELWVLKPEVMVTTSPEDTRFVW